LYQQQTSYDLNSLLNDPSATSTYGVDSFDLSLLGTDYQFDSYQQLKLDDVNESTTNNLALSIEIDSTFAYPSQTQMKQEDLQDWSVVQQYYLQSSSLISPISPATTIYSSPSPCPSVEYPTIKQEYPLILPPSPPDSNGVPSPQSIHCDSYKIEQFDDSYQTALSPSAGENFIDINYLLENDKNKQDHQVLRGFLQDTTFQRKHNLKPLPLENLFGGLSQRGDIEPVISLALQHAKLEVQATCSALNISPNPHEWTEQQVQLWINSTITQFKLEPLAKCEMLFPENGQMLTMLSDEEFIRRAPQVNNNSRS
jgi:SAM pointed domain-containing ETS transcription factor